MKVLVTGSSGMLGGALCGALKDDYQVVGVDTLSSQIRGITFRSADITKQDETIEKIVKESPDVVVHSAAYTDVDGCQKNEKLAFEANAWGTQTVALAAKECRALLYYISTDFVFDGEKDTPYKEDDTPNPINIYGRSKFEGEQIVASSLSDFIIIRSSWLFGMGGRNFVETILAKARSEERIDVVHDQKGSPTYTNDLAAALKGLIAKSDLGRGIYHITNSGSCSWYEFALAIKEAAQLDNVEIRPVSSDQFNSPTPRPRMSILENKRYQEAVHTPLRHWQEALKEYIDERTGFS